MGEVSEERIQAVIDEMHRRTERRLMEEFELALAYARGVPGVMKPSPEQAESEQAVSLLRLRKPGEQVNHKDLNKYNPALVNLEIVTVAENAEHALANGAFVNCPGGKRPVWPHRHGDGAPNVKITMIQVRALRRAFALMEGPKMWRYRRLGELFGLSVYTVQDVVLRRSRKDVV